MTRSTKYKQDNNHPVINRAKEIESEMMLTGFCDSPMTRMKALYRTISEVTGRDVIPEVSQGKNEDLYREVGITLNEALDYMYMEMKR
jgi:hypothetical protein